MVLTLIQHNEQSVALTLHNDLLCNGTCSVTGVHNLLGAETEKILKFFGALSRVRRNLPIVFLIRSQFFAGILIS